MTELHEQWMERGRQIAAAEDRIAHGGRRTAREEQPHLDQLQQQHQQAAAEVRVTSARATELGAAVGGLADREQMSRDADQIRRHGPELVTAAAETDLAQLAAGQERLGDLDARLERTVGDLTEVGEQLAARSESYPPFAGALRASAQLRQRGPRAPDSVGEIDQDIER